MAADTIFYNGIIATVNDNFDFIEAVAVANGKIVAVGTQKEIMLYRGPDTECVDLNGAMMLPGIHDAHIHASDIIHNRGHLQCGGFKSIIELQASLKSFCRSVSQGWVLGNGLSPEMLEKGISGKDLDEVAPNLPVILMFWNGHGCVANAKAMEASGIDSMTPDPSGGMIERDADGNPTGVFREVSAMQLAFSGMKDYSPEAICGKLCEMQHIMNRLGYTAYTDCTIGPGNTGREGGAAGPNCLEAYRLLLQRNQMTCRVSVGFYSARNGIQSYDVLKKDLDSGMVPKYEDRTWLDCHMFKLFCDGVADAHSAWFKQDYADMPGNHGSSCFSPDEREEIQIAELRRAIALVHDSGYQVGIHCIGNRAVKEAINAILEAQKNNPKEGMRHCIIHGDTFGDIEDLKRAAENGIMVSAQPTLDRDYEAKSSIVGKELGERMRALKPLVENGVIVAGGSDNFDGELPDWRKGIQCAVERRSSETGRLTRQDLATSVKEALKMFTINAAYQESAEKERGSIEIGKLADFTVIDRNILEIPVEEIAKVRILQTVVNGKTVYRNRD